METEMAKEINKILKKREEKKLELSNAQVVAKRMMGIVGFPRNHLWSCDIA